MLNFLKKLWSDPVWSKVIAAGIIIILTAAISGFTGFWPTIAIVASAVWSWLTSTIAIPIWLLFVLSICTAVALLVSVLLVVSILRDNSVSEPTSHSYTTDEFFNIRWRWSYMGGGTIYDLYSFCTKCDYQVFPFDTMVYSRFGSKYKCGDCGEDLGTFAKDQHEVEQEIKLLIQRKIRNGEWRQALEHQLKS